MTAPDRLRHLVGALAVFAAIASAPAWAESDRDEADCLDPETGVLSRATPRQCQGRIVTPEEAEQIRQARIDRIRSAVSKKAGPVAPNLRIASAASGFYVSPDGWILTNAHVVANCTAMSAERTDGRDEAVTVEHTSSEIDLALVKAKTPPEAVATFRDGVNVFNQPVRAIGYPNLGLQAIKPQAAPGTLTGPGSHDGRRIIFQADIRHGNSGGPLVDQEGLVVGVVFAKIDTPEVYRKTGQTVRNLGFAVTVPTATAFLSSHGIRPRLAESAPVLEDIEVFSHAHRYIARLICWK